jgi:hypothetical protein
VYSTAWSPDSNHLLVSLSSKVIETGVDPIYGFEVRDRHGSLVQKVLGQDPAGWLDETHILAFQGLGDSFDEPGYSKNAHASILAIDGSPPTPVDIAYGDGQLLSGHGEVALPRFLGHPAPNVSKYEFRVWSPAGTSAVHSGYPFAWSPDGTKLAIWHGFEPTRGPAGWLEVVSWPGLETLYEDEPHQTIGNASFDPSSAHIAFERSADETDVYPPNYLRIAALDGEPPVDLPPNPPQTGISSLWVGEMLHTIAFGSNVEQVWDTKGELIDERAPVAPFASSSRDGSTVVYWNVGEPSGSSDSFFVVRDGLQATYDVPSSHHYISGDGLSPDGRSIYVAGDGMVFVRDL